MSKNIYIILILVGFVGALIIYFQNSMSSTTAYTPFGPKMSSTVIIYSTILGTMFGYGLCGFLNSKKDNSFDDSDDGF